MVSVGSLAHTAGGNVESPNNAGGRSKFHHHHHRRLCKAERKGLNLAVTRVRIIYCTNTSNTTLFSHIMRVRGYASHMSRCPTYTRFPHIASSRCRSLPQCKGHRCEDSMSCGVVKVPVYWALVLTARVPKTLCSRIGHTRQMTCWDIA